MKNIDFETFKELVRTCSKVTEKADAADIGTVRNYKEIFAEIASLFGSEHKIALRNLDQLLSELAIKAVSDGEPVDLIFETIRVLIDSLKPVNTNAPISDDPWREAILLIIGNQHIFFAYVVPERIFPARFIALGNHVKALREKGYAVSITNGRPQLSPEELTHINGKIEQLCKTLGAQP